MGAARVRGSWPARRAGAWSTGASGGVQAALADSGAAMGLNGGLAEAYIDQAAALSAVGSNTGFWDGFGWHPRRPEVGFFDEGSAEEDVLDVKGRIWVTDGQRPLIPGGRFHG